MTLEIYDDGGATMDRYTVVYLHLPEPNCVQYMARQMSEHPLDPQGCCNMAIAMPGPHLGNRIRLTDLPKGCQQLVLRDMGAGYDEVHPEDYGLTADELEEKFSPNGDGENPAYTREAWREQVQSQSTSASYWDWMESEIYQEMEACAELVDAGLEPVVNTEFPTERAVA
jgi:hypothetical protein